MKPGVSINRPPNITSAPSSTSRAGTRPAYIASLKRRHAARPCARMRIEPRIASAIRIATVQATADLLADLDEHRELGDRHDDEEQDERKQHGEDLTRYEVRSASSASSSTASSSATRCASGERGERARQPLGLEHGVGGHAPLPLGGEHDREPALVAPVAAAAHEAAALEVLDDDGRRALGQREVTGDVHQRRRRRWPARGAGAGARAARAPARRRGAGRPTAAGRRAQIVHDRNCSRAELDDRLAG